MYDSDSKKNDPRQRQATQQSSQTQTQPDHLLDELTSIRALLDSDQRPATGTDIPMLDDVVGFAASFKAVDSEPAPALLDLDGIFDDELDTESTSTRLAFPKFTLDVTVSDVDDEPASANDHIARPPQTNSPRAALIQELVAEFLPQIEATLRERLNGLDDAALRTLKKTE
jgi:hypothetical protein